MPENKSETRVYSAPGVRGQGSGGDLWGLQQVRDGKLNFIKI